jgi:hypothetical protein
MAKATQAQKKKILQLYWAQVPVSEITRRCSVARATVFRYVAEEKKQREEGGEVA